MNLTEKEQKILNNFKAKLDAYHTKKIEFNMKEYCIDFDEAILETFYVEGISEPPKKHIIQYEQYYLDEYEPAIKIVMEEMNFPRSLAIDRIKFLERMPNDEFEDNPDLYYGPIEEQKFYGIDLFNKPVENLLDIENKIVEIRKLYDIRRLDALPYLIGFNLIPDIVPSDKKTFNHLWEKLPEKYKINKDEDFVLFLREKRMEPCKTKKWGEGFALYLFNNTEKEYEVSYTIFRNGIKGTEKENGLLLPNNNIFILEDYKKAIEKYDREIYIRFKGDYTYILKLKLNKDVFNNEKRFSSDFYNPGYIINSI